MALASVAPVLSECPRSSHYFHWSVQWKASNRQVRAEGRESLGAPWFRSERIERDGDCILLREGVGVASLAPPKLLMFERAFRFGGSVVKLVT